MDLKGGMEGPGGRGAAPAPGEGEQARLLAWASGLFPQPPTPRITGVTR